jgi:deoxyribonuclease-4
MTEGNLLLGAHESIAGGVENALARGQEVGCDTIQIFVKTPNRWASKPIADENVSAFREAVEETGIWPVFAHGLYLVNLATPDDTLWQKSLAALTDDLERCEQLGLPGLVIHPGSHMGSGEEAGLARIAAALDEVHSRLPGAGVQVWLEVTAGQGGHLGYTFDQIQAMIEGVRTREGYEATWSEFDEKLGLDRLQAIHLNDSKKELGSRVDRHEHIGQGLLGLEPFRFLLNDPRFRGIPMTLETDKGPDLVEDKENLAVLRSLVE